MACILPAGEHYGQTVRSWGTDSFKISEVHYAPSAKNSWHGNEQALLVSIESGGYRKQIGRGELECSKHNLLFIPAERMQADVFGPTETTCLVVDFSSVFLRRTGELGASFANIALLSGAQFSALAAQLRQEFRHIDSVSPLVLEGLLLSVLGCGFRQYSSVFRPRVPSWLMAAKDYLHDNYSESLRMETVAKEVGVHPVHLSREFRRFFKITPGEYLRNVRVDYAANQLTQTSLPLSEIAIAAGFADQAHFSRTFRRVTHYAPLEYRCITRKS